MPDYIYMLETRLSQEQQNALRLVQQVARDHSMNVYLAGGAVRDLLTGLQVRDLDFSVQGNALNLLKDFENAGAEMQGINEHLQVLYLLLPGRVRAEIASARTEKYEKPSKPEIQPATMAEDLRRRDFTANAMALSLNPGSYALFMDPLNGVADIEARLLRLVHNYGFYEEPSRMIKAVRFMTRFGWTMEERTQTRYESAKENNYIGAISKAALGYELEQVMHEPDPLAVMRALEAEGYLQLMYEGFTPAKVDEVGLQRVAETRDKILGLGLSVDPSAANAEFLTRKLPEKDIEAIQKMLPRKGFVRQWKAQDEAAKELGKRVTSKEADTPSHTWKLLMSVPPETILYLAVTTKSQAVESKLNNFFSVWPQARQRIPYTIMQEMRITQELPIHQQLVEEMFLLMIDGKLSSEEEIRAFLEPHSPPLPVAPPSMGRRGRAKKAAKKVAKHAPAKHAAPSEKPAGVLETVAAAVGTVVGKIEKVLGTASNNGHASKKAAAKKEAPAKKEAAKAAAPASKKAGGKSVPTSKRNVRRVDVGSKLKRAAKKAKSPAKAKPKVTGKVLGKSIKKPSAAPKKAAKKMPAKAQKKATKRR
jgi:tRNA nucleotidyltransferase (CCA-adding enzyme)